MDCLHTGLRVTLQLSYQTIAKHDADLAVRAFAFAAGGRCSEVYTEHEWDLCGTNSRVQGSNTVAPRIASRPPLDHPSFNPRDIMPESSSLAVEFSLPNGQTVSNHDVDSWELKASRRALKNLKTLLAGQPMLDLLQSQIEAADVYYKDIIARSHGQYKESRIDMKVRGLTKADFMAWWQGWMRSLMSPDAKQRTFLETMLPAHPEHYALPPYAAGIVETIGEHVARVRIQPSGDLPDFVRACGDASYQPLSAVGTLDDGSVLFYIFQEVREGAGGCEFRLRLLFPAAAPQVFFDEHAEHLAVEFRSFVGTAFAQTRGG